MEGGESTAGDTSHEGGGLKGGFWRGEGQEGEAGGETHGVERYSGLSSEMVDNGLAGWGRVGETAQEQ